MTTLTLAKLAEIEAAFDDQNSYLHYCNPATVAALCRIARVAVEWERMAVSPSEWDDFDEAELALSDAIRAAGLIE